MKLNEEKHLDPTQTFRIFTRKYLEAGVVGRVNDLTTTRFFETMVLLAAGRGWLLLSLGTIFRKYTLKKSVCIYNGLGGKEVDRREQIASPSLSPTMLTWVNLSSDGNPIRPYALVSSQSLKDTSNVHRSC